MIQTALCALALAGLVVAGSCPAKAQEPPPPAADEQGQPPLSEQAPAESAQPPAEPASAPPTPVAPTPMPVEVEKLGQLDLFSTGRELGLGTDLWRGSSADIAREVIPTLAVKSLSPAAADLGRRVLAQASTAPQGAGGDLELAMARARALLVLGDAEDASLIMDRTPDVANHADLSELAAEAALVGEQDDKACAIANALADGRSAPYWLRLRAFCQARAGKTDEAQLTLNLASAPGQYPTLTRLLSAYVSGVGDPGPASLRGGLDFAVSRALKLDLTPAMASAAPAIRQRWLLKNPPPPPPPPSDPLIQDAITAASSDHPDPTVLERLVDQAAREPGPKARPRLQAAAAILASLGGDMTGGSRAQFADFDLGRLQAQAARLIALDRAADAGLKGETALLALSIAETGGAGGPPPAERSWIIHALIRSGFKTDARTLAIEGLTGLGNP